MLAGLFHERDRSTAGRPCPAVGHHHPAPQMAIFGRTANMKTVGPKKRGRRATGRDPKVEFRLPKSLLDRIDRWASRFDDMDRSTALRCLLGLGFGRSSRSKAPTVYDPKGLKAHHSKRVSASKHARISTSANAEVETT